MKLVEIHKSLPIGKLVSPPSIPNTMSFYHGGDLDNYKLIKPQKSGAYEYGPGLYITTHYGTALKYAKGGRKLYLITVNNGVEMDNISIDISIIKNFLIKYGVASKVAQIINILREYESDNKVPASIFNNICLDEKAIKHSNSGILRQFYVDLGIDYKLIKNPYGWGEVMMVLFNMKKIAQITPITKNDRVEFDIIKN